MKHALPIIALAGLSFSAIAQEEFSITFGDITGTVTTGAVLSVDVFGDSTFGTHMLGGSFGVSATTNNFEVLDMAWTAAEWNQFPSGGGHLGGGNYEPIIFGQLIINAPVPPFDRPAVGSELGNLIGLFQIEVGQLGSFWSLNLQVTAGDPFSLQSYNHPSGATLDDTQGNLTLGSASVAFVPAPSAIGLLAVCGLTTTRRIRSEA